jgi:hypothetical protein
MNKKILSFAIYSMTFILLWIIAFLIILPEMFYSLKPHSQFQEKIGEITLLKCDNTEIVYYRSIPGFFGITKQIKTTQDKSDFSQEECIKEENKLNCNYLYEHIGSKEGYGYCIKKYPIELCSECFK